MLSPKKCKSLVWKVELSLFATVADTLTKERFMDVRGSFRTKLRVFRGTFSPNTTHNAVCIPVANNAPQGCRCVFCF